MSALLDLPGAGGFEVAYIDPPWAFHRRGKAAKGDRNPDRHYPTMKLAEIKALPIARLMAKNATVFCWTSGPWLAQTLDCLSAWGFRYSTYGFVWVKLRPGMGTQAFMQEADLTFGLGYHTRANVELVLIGRRGTPKRVSRTVRQVVFAERREHSRKPDIVRDRIVQLMGDVPRVELFARETAPGWAGWGNEPTKFDVPLRPVVSVDPFGPPWPYPTIPLLEAAA